jgi:nuclear transport factor 2 (NTF2) superfamily protein
MATATITPRPPLPPFTRESATQKVRMAEDSWNTRDPEKVALAYTVDSRWRNRSEFIRGRTEIIAFLSRKWAKELDYRLIKELWAFTDNRIAVRFAYEWHDDSGHWYRAFGNENWEFNADGLMAARFASINDLPISESDRKYHWPFPPPGQPSRTKRLGVIASSIALSITPRDLPDTHFNCRKHSGACPCLPYTRNTVETC